MNDFPNSDLFRPLHAYSRYVIYRQPTNMICILVGNKIADHSDVIEASPVGGFGASYTGGLAVYVDVEHYYNCVIMMEHVSSLPTLSTQHSL